MEDKVKYYTPEIEEFHVGFDFEFNGTDCNWIRTGYEKHTILKSEKEYFGLFTLSWVENIYKNNISDWIRVKYLDKEDIESLGWVVRNDKTRAICKNEYTLGDFILSLLSNGTVIIRHPNTKNHSEWGKQSSYHHVFTGVAKNKSELSRLMEQLGIKNG
jgi:hypothetical protein